MEFTFSAWVVAQTRDWLSRAAALLSLSCDAVERRSRLPESYLDSVCVVCNLSHDGNLGPYVMRNEFAESGF